MPTPSITPETVSIKDFTSSVIYIAIGIVAIIAVLFIFATLIGKRKANNEH